MTDKKNNRNALPKGYCLGDYEIQNVLGEGAFGITYLAKNKKLDTMVAIKEYLPNVIAVRDSDYTIHAKSQKDEDNFTWALDRFIKEARSLAQFKHPNIVHILFCFKANNTAYMVMKYEQGQSLEKLLKEGKTFTEEELLKILLPLLEGLELVHQLDYIHRDIKPGNIYFRDKDQSLVLIDFGAARYEVNSRSQTVTEIFTPGYAPSEQYETTDKQGSWTDIYALGAVLYRLISGKIPIASSKRIRALYKKQPDPLTRAVEIGRGAYSQQLLESIDWALKINKDERPQSVKAWRKKLLDKATSVDNSRWKWGLVRIGVLLVSVITVIYFIPQAKVKEDYKLVATEQARYIAELETKIKIANVAAKNAQIEHKTLEKKLRQQNAEIDKLKKETPRIEYVKNDNRLVATEQTRCIIAELETKIKIANVAAKNTQIEREAWEKKLHQRDAEIANLKKERRRIEHFVKENNKLVATKHTLRIGELEQKIKLANVEAKNARIEHEILEKKLRQKDAEIAIKEEEIRRIEHEYQAMAAEHRHIKHAKKAAIDLVSGYYEDLNNNDESSAIQKWIKRPTKATIAGMTGNEYFRVNNAKLICYSSNYADVRVDVGGKPYCCKAENWKLTIQLKKVSGEWKIVKFKNAYKY